ncbi:hypothetical protein RZN05_02295 [Sphingomonas sp. HF-S4]|uniref:Uncharacterized protein n=1 Tax=Sphingomonas agrestis TaxID=3080540 RepID=A0ABU3Y374_9SPHN|nr:hypothetical protein [Sphingomonas sp. HF-S4]MDV3455799.1 hypothetical protein [Sphingomonas sp. HF-S4]
MTRRRDVAEQARGTVHRRACDRLLWRLERPRRELRQILARTGALIVPMPRRDVEHLLCWFDAVEAEDEDAMPVRVAIEDRIETLIACLDALDTDPDLEDDLDDVDDLEPDDRVA